MLLSISFYSFLILPLPRLSADNKPQRRTSCIAVYRDALLKLYRVAGLVGDFQLQRLTGRYCIGRTDYLHTVARAVDACHYQRMVAGVRQTEDGLLLLPDIERTEMVFLPVGPDRGLRYGRLLQGLSLNQSEIQFPDRRFCTGLPTASTRLSLSNRKVWKVMSVGKRLRRFRLSSRSMQTGCMKPY